MIEWSIKHYRAVFSLFILSVLSGFLVANKIPIQMFPSIPITYYYINTKYRGASASEVKANVSRHIIHEINGIKGIKNVSADNREHFSSIFVESEIGYDKEQLYKDLVSALGRAAEKMPEAVEASQLSLFAPDKQRSFGIAVLSKQLTKTQVTQIIEDEIKPFLLYEKIIADVQIFSGSKQEVQILMDPQKLFDKEISLYQIQENLRKSGSDVPLGRIDAKSGELFSFKMDSRFDELSKIEQQVIRFYGNEKPTLISQLGQVQYKHNDSDKKYYFNQQEAIFLSLYKNRSVNVFTLNHYILAKLEELNAKYKSQGISFAIAHENTQLLRREIIDVLESAVIGIILTLVVVFFFLGSVRSTFITALAIPNSLLGALVAIYFLDFSINMTTLMALSLAVGLLVDDAIVVRENIFKFIEKGYSAYEAALLGAKEVYLAVIATTLAIIAVFGPAAFMAGVVGTFFKEFGITVCVVMLISLLDSLTVAPAMSYLMQKNSHEKPSALTQAILKPFQALESVAISLHKRCLQVTLKHNRLTIFAIFCVFILGVALATRLPFTLLKPYDFSSFDLVIESPSHYSFEKVRRQSLALTEKVATIKGIRSTSCAIGEWEEYHKTQCLINLDEIANTFAFKGYVADELRKSFPELHIVAKHPDVFNRRSREMDIEISAKDSHELLEWSEKFVKALEQNSTIRDISMPRTDKKTEHRISILDKKLAEFGVNKQLIANELRTVINGQQIAEFVLANDEKIPVELKADFDAIDPLSALDKLRVPNMNLYNVELKQLIALKTSMVDFEITTKNNAFVAKIGWDFAHKRVGLQRGYQDAKAIWQSLNPPPHIQMLPTANSLDFEELKFNFMVVSLVALGLLYTVLVILYNSYTTPLIILTAIPMSVSGAFLAIYASNEMIDVYSLLGALLLMGVSTKNSIILVDFIEQKVTQGLSLTEAIVLSSEDRFRPIIMTSLALTMGALPLAIGLSAVSDTKSSLGIATIGGVISSTILTLYLVPSIYMLMQRWNQKPGNPPSAPEVL